MAILLSRGLMPEGWAAIGHLPHGTWGRAMIELIDHGHVECIERPPASTSGLHTLRSLYH
jgi:hypothetical protein